MRYTDDYLQDKKPKFSDFRKLSIKDVMELCYCSRRTACRIRKCIKKEFGVEILLYLHYKLYFCEDLAE